MLNHLHIYTVHRKPENRSVEGLLFVREGFNFFAFLFTLLWALYHRLWIPAALLFATQAMLLWLETSDLLHPFSVMVLQFGVQAVAGFFGNDWLRVGLARRGYVLADIATGDSKLRAEQRYFDRLSVSGAL